VLNEFFKQLEIQECIHLSNNEVILFDLWKIGFDCSNVLYINEKNAYGVWEDVDNLDCKIPLFIESGRVIFDGRHSGDFNEMDDLEHRLIKWKSYFIDAVNTRICFLYDELNNKRTQRINIKIMNYIQVKMNQINFELLSCLTSLLHSFFQKNFFSTKPLSEVFPYAPDKVSIHTLISLSAHSESIKIYNHFLPHHLAIVKFIHISPVLLKTIENGKNTFTKTSFAKLILSNIDDQARFDNFDLTFFINCDHLTLRQLSIDKKQFIPWLQFFSKVSRNCKFENIHLLIREFMRIGHKGCLKNKKYIEAIFSFFQSKSFQNNTSDLNYAIEYSLIINCMNWNCLYTGNVDRFIKVLDCSVDEIRKSDVFRAFMRFERQNSYYLKSGYSYGSLSKQFISDLLVNCHILVGLDWSDSLSSDMGFVLQKIDDSYVLIGSDNQPDRSFYQTIIVGEDVDVILSSSDRCESYFDQVLRSYAI
jgi:hypothetical protein